ncbi:hypothetical protein KC331_g15011 [Hortaea werneckii]|uniref:Autophagy-related protein 14 n=1 Tax=Hortaea werneckii TaxID=91943 RepID=A0A3M7CDM4_HORWE|nr:hypothetical protein KC331_g15011 [Hortaea werneckii]KAI7717256.1 hypothetical protein KC353_g4725 [Hortaea werneckii]RMY50232.1 hypothetical protein D0865_07023 [Hortaea werneckii]
MHCSICCKAFNGYYKKDRPTCVSCAQALLFTPRVQQASALLDREKRHTHAEAILRPGNDGVLAALPEDADWDAITSAVQSEGVKKAQDEQKAIQARVEDITGKAQELRQQIEDYRLYLKNHRESNAQRRRDLEHERAELQKQKPRALEPLQIATRKAASRLDKVRLRTVDARALLCREAAALSGLRKTKGTDGVSQYWLGDVPIPDLRALNGKLNLEKYEMGRKGILYQPHEVVTASMDNVCRLLGSCCHYLSVRLPAEILLPHNDFPHALIMMEKASYRQKSVPWPYKSHSQTSSPAASRLIDPQNGGSASPRSLHLTKPLRELQKEDSKAFGYFVEGASLLALDVAFLCRTQGLDIANTFDDFCAIGRNLFQLFSSPGQQRPPLDRHPSSATAKTDRSRGKPASTTSLGVYSHGSAHHSLAGYEGLDILSAWRLPSSSRLVDKLRSFLINEISGAEWDFLSDKEWDEERADEMPVLVGGERKAASRQDPAMSIMTVTSHDRNDISTQNERQRGTSGWTKVRGRESNV